MTATSRPQLTLRAAISGMLLGGIMSLSNLYVVLKTGWSLGVTITAGVLAYAIFAFLYKVKLTKSHFGMLENNAMQSVASTAGIMNGGGNLAAIGALLMITGTPMPGGQMFVWMAAIAMLGVVMAIPLKQQMINVEKLTFPSGIAAAETIRALHAEEAAQHGQASADGGLKAKLLGWGGAIGAAVAFFKDAHGSWMPFNLPEKLMIPFLTIRGRPLSDFTLSIETSLVLVAAGAIIGFRAAWSMMLGAIVNYAIVVPFVVDAGIIGPKLGYRNIVAWSVWFGSAMILTSGLLAFAFQWRTVLRAIQSVAGVVHSHGGAGDTGMREVPMKWFFIGIACIAPVVIFLQNSFFNIPVWMGIFSVFLAFFIAIVACRATGETDITPTGALGKITQVTYGVLDPGNVTTNLMSANTTGGVGTHSSDLMVDLKAGYLLKADPIQQFWAQFLGVIAGAIFVVPAFRLLIPTADVLGSDKWPAPASQTWKGVAEMLAKGLDTLHPTAQMAILIGGGLGIALVLLEKAFPKAKAYIPSPISFGLAFTMPASNAIAFFIGASITLWLEKFRPKTAELAVIPVSSGIIAGESIIAVIIAALAVLA